MRIFTRLEKKLIFCIIFPKNFQVFGPVFDSNARWSNRRPVPRLGDDASDLNKVIHSLGVMGNITD